MAARKTENQFDKMSYEEMEENLKNIIEKMDDPTLPLDTASSLFKQGKDLYEEMEKRLADLQKQVTDTIKKE